MNTTIPIATLQSLLSPPPGKTGWPWTEATPDLPPTMPDGTPWPRISIVTPSYNQGQFIEETLRSVLLQGYPNLEYIVIDGGSTDESVEIIRKYAPWLSYWVSEPDGGQSYAINRGIQTACGSICSWLNSDDVLQPEALIKVASYFTAHPYCHFLTGNGDFVDTQRTLVEFHKEAAPYSHRELLNYHKGNYLPQPAVFFDRNAFLQAGGLDVDLRYAMDLDLWLRLRAAHQLHAIPTTLALLRHHAAAKTWRDNELAIREVSVVIHKHLHSVGITEHIRVRAGLRRLLASAACKYGLTQYFARNQSAAQEAMRRAIAIWPFAPLLRNGRTLALRLVLPQWMRKIVLHNP